MTLTTKEVTVGMITMITKIIITVTITKKNNNNNNNNANNTATQVTIKAKTISNRKHLFKTRGSIYNKKRGNIKIHMFSRNFIYPLPRDGTLSAEINNDHNHASRYKSYCQEDKLG